MKSENINFNKLVALVITLSTFFTVFFVNPRQALAANTAHINVAYGIAGSQGVLDLISYINRDRTSGGAFYIKNGVKVSVKSSSLFHSADLQRIATERATEMVVKEGYTRPNGESFNTLRSIPSNMTSDFERYYISDRILSGQELYDRWFNWGTAESAEFLMSDFYKSIGVCCLRIEINGTDKFYYVLELSNKSDSKRAEVSDKGGYPCVQGFYYDPSVVPATYKMVIDEKKVIVGDECYIFPSLYSYRGYAADQNLTYATGITYKISCSDSSVSITDTDTCIPKKTGRFKIKVSYYYNGSLFFADDAYINVTTKNVNDTDITISSAPVTYTGSAVIPNITVKWGSKVCAEGVDYKVVNPKNNINCTDSSSVEIQGIGKFSGTRKYEFSINPVNLPDVSSITNPIFNGSAQYPSVKIVFNGRTLVEGKDYELVANGYSDAGSYHGNLYGKGNFKTSLRKIDYKILPYTIKDSQVGTISNQLYRGVGISPEVKIVANNQTLKNGVDYTISYSNNINVGTATATITFKGNYTSEKPIVRNFQIVTPTPIATPKPTATPIPTATPKPTATPIATPTVTVAPSVTSKPEATPVVTVKPTAVATPIATPTVTVAPSVTGKPEVTPVVTVKPTTIVTPIATPTATVTPTVTSKPEATPVVTVKPTATTVPKPTTTVAPTITSKPEATPAVTDKPTATTVPKPTTTVAPSVTSKPEATPVVTVKPTATTVPKPTTTVAPSVTGKPEATPVVTDKPTATAVPQPTTTVAPIVTNKPEVTPVVTANPTVTVTDVPTAEVTKNPTTEPTTEPTKAPSVEDFAERLYTTCLGRDAEEAGKDFWVSELKNGKPGSEVAEGFFFSPEFVGFNLDNEEYITRLYRTFMGREPDKDGIDYWSSEMEKGMDRKFVFDGFVNSPEWADICLSYGIRSGGLATPTFEKDASDAVKAFAERLYTTCLGRKAEEAGLKYWSQELANLRQTGTVAAAGFFYSPEFIGLNTSDDEYVTRLYRTFMGREPEEAGFEFWTEELKSGKGRDYVFDGFSSAPEFANICSDAGIMR